MVPMVKPLILLWILSIHAVVNAQGGIRGQDSRELNPNLQLTYVGAMSDALLGECQGDCAMDADCADGLACFHRGELEMTEVPFCNGGSSIATFDFCYRHYSGYYGALNFVADNPTFKLQACWGDCDTDNDCQPGLKCYQRGSGLVPGCSGTDFRQKDFCYDPTQGIAPTAAPVPPTAAPVPPTAAPVLPPTAAPVLPPTAAPVPPPVPAPTPLPVPTKPTKPPKPTKPKPTKVVSGPVAPVATPFKCPKVKVAASCPAPCIFSNKKCFLP